VGEPRQNGHAERLMRTIKEEAVDLSEYRDFANAQAQLGAFLDAVYNVKRIHSALGYLTPAEFEGRWRKRSVPLQHAPSAPRHPAFSGAEAGRRGAEGARR